MNKSYETKVQQNRDKKLLALSKAILDLRHLDDVAANLLEERLREILGE